MLKPSPHKIEEILIDQKNGFEMEKKLKPSPHKIEEIQGIHSDVI